MPASGYELGMGEFVLPGLGVFLIGWALICLAGWLLNRAERKRSIRNTPGWPRHEHVMMPYWDGKRYWRWDDGEWHPLDKDGNRDEGGYKH